MLYRGILFSSCEEDSAKERRNGNGARVYGANLDAKIAHGKEAQFQLGFTAQRSRYTHEEAWTKVDGVDPCAEWTGHRLQVRERPARGHSVSFP